MKIDEFQDALQLLDSQVFERFVADLLLRSGKFENVHLSGPGPDLGVDIEATERRSVSVAPRTWFFQVKHFRVASGGIARYMGAIHQLHASRGHEAELALVVSGSVTRAVLERVRAAGVHLWDATKLAELATPDLLAEYFGVASDVVASSNAVKDRVSALEAALEETPPGRPHWSAYQRLAADVLEFLFCPPLEPPRYELSDADARNRRDVIFENAASSGVWAQIRSTYAGHYIVVDAKNYVGPLKKGPVVDIAHYLKPHGCGLFALLLSRRGLGGAAKHAVREQWIGAQKMIVNLSDSELKDMLLLKRDGGRPEEVIRGTIAEFRMGL